MATNFPTVVLENDGAILPLFLPDFAPWYAACIKAANRVSLDHRGLSVKLGTWLFVSPEPLVQFRKRGSDILKVQIFRFETHGRCQLSEVPKLCAMGWIFHDLEPKEVEDKLAGILRRDLERPGIVRTLGLR